MKVQYFNHQNERDPMDGVVITASAQLAELLDNVRREPPFIAKLEGDNGFEILMGVSEKFGWAQYSASDSGGPYLMAVSPEPPMKRGYLEFLTADTPTPIAARYVIRFDELRQVALYFLKTGEKSDAVSWQLLNPRATKEDAERPAD
jgi:Immunity protein Imm1